MFLHYTGSARQYFKRKTKVAGGKRMHRTDSCATLPSPEAMLSVLEDAKRTGQLELPGVTISSQTEIGQTEKPMNIPKQRVCTGRKLIIWSSLADTSCSSLGILGLLGLLNSTLGTSYTLDTPSLTSVLRGCITKDYDFGTAYGCLCNAWCNSIFDIQIDQEIYEKDDIMRRRNAVVGSRIVDPRIDPRRVWDLYSNRVIPWWSCRPDFDRLVTDRVSRPISHAWVDEEDRVDVWTPINGYQWPVPIPKGANLDLIRIEMLNLGLEYTWLDVLCLRQRGGPREDLRVEEWKLDVPTIGAIYHERIVVCYLSGLGLPLTLKEGDLESDRCWFRRAWTVQEVGWKRVIAGDTPDGPLHTKPIDGAGNYKNKILTRFHKQLESVDITRNDIYGMLSVMQDRISTNPVDKVAGLAYSLPTRTIPAYYESQSLEDAWTALVKGMLPEMRGFLFFTFPEPGTGCKKWRPSWEQVMKKSLPKDTWGWQFVARVWRCHHDWFDGFHIERGFVRKLAVGGEEGIDRCGELVVKDTHGISHTFHIAASHQYPIPEDTYTLLGTNPFRRRGGIEPPQYWIVGQRLPDRIFKKVSVFRMTSINEIEGLARLAAQFRSILA